MSGMNRRDAVKLAAAGLTGASAPFAAAVNAQEGPKATAASDRWKGRKLAAPKDLEKATQPILASLGVEPPGPKAAPNDNLIKQMEAAREPLGIQPVSAHWANPRPDLNGLRIKLPNRPEIYLIDRGFRRWIPDPGTYNNLFRDWNGIVVDIDIDDIPLGPAITSGAVLVRAAGTAPVYLVDQGVKRWIVSPAIMDQYYFAWNRVYVLPAGSVDPIPVGPNIDS